MEKLIVKLEFNKFPKKYTCDGEDISPKIDIEGLKKAKSLVLIMDDPDAPIGTFTHWVMYNIEPTTVLPENVPRGLSISKPIKALHGRNDFGEYGYGGPCPPSGKPHRYFFKIYALDTILDLPPAQMRRHVEEHMKGHIIMQGETMATYGR
jgi:Raf kinase inhibitor-like YbhB/YbcL family protein